MVNQQLEARRAHIHQTLTQVAERLVGVAVKRLHHHDNDHRQVRALYVCWPELPEVKITVESRRSRDMWPSPHEMPRRIFMEVSDGGPRGQHGYRSNLVRWMGIDAFRKNPDKIEKALTKIQATLEKHAAEDAKLREVAGAYQAAVDDMRARLVGSSELPPGVTVTADEVRITYRTRRLDIATKIIDAIREDD